MIRRTDFFELLRSEHEIAVKMLWQFLGVLADRLDQTSKDLSSAREELAAEDITDAIFPEADLDRPGTQLAVAPSDDPVPAAESVETGA